MRDISSISYVTRPHAYVDIVNEIQIQIQGSATNVLETSFTLAHQEEHSQGAPCLASAGQVLFD